MAKYRVSLALLVPQNFEVMVEAGSPKDALMKGYNIYNGPNWDRFGAYIDDEYVGKAESDFDGDDRIEDGNFNDPEEINGVYVEKLD